MHVIRKGRPFLFHLWSRSFTFYKPKPGAIKDQILIRLHLTEISLRIDMSLHSNTLSWFRANQWTPYTFWWETRLLWSTIVSPSTLNHIGGIIVTMLTSSLVDRRFNPKTKKLYWLLLRMKYVVYRVFTVC
jgi:hypothetical protein